jgi:hypothetical protein
MNAERGQWKYAGPAGASAFQRSCYLIPELGELASWIYQHRRDLWSLVENKKPQEYVEILSKAAGVSVQYGVGDVGHGMKRILEGLISRHRP